jgi:hypothetical protein
MKNTIHVLTKAQTDELRILWQPMREYLDPEREAFVRFKLTRDCATLTHKQLLVIATTLVQNETRRIPEWLHQLLDPVAYAEVA